jgi:hypothetical protein
LDRAGSCPAVLDFAKISIGSQRYEDLEVTGFSLGLYRFRVAEIRIFFVQIFAIILYVLFCRVFKFFKEFYALFDISDPF